MAAPVPRSPRVEGPYGRVGPHVIVSGVCLLCDHEQRMIQPVDCLGLHTQCGKCGQMAIEVTSTAYPVPVHNRLVESVVDQALDVYRVANRPRPRTH